MEDTSIGWIAAIFIGGIAGWLAEKVTGSNIGIIANIVLGIIGAGIGSFIFTKLGIVIPGSAWVAYLVAGFVGAALLLFAVRIFYPSRLT
jgi:uncharacterized membrane protein YeaQ/YmgE (transglycosylase-associated protein family)